MSLFKLIAWATLVGFIYYGIYKEKLIKDEFKNKKKNKDKKKNKKKNKKKKEDFVNQETNEYRGVGTFGVFKYGYDKDKIENDTTEDILTTEDKEKLYKFPLGNKLPLSDGRNILETRIQSFNTDVKIVNKQKMIHEIDNQVFEDEFVKMIDLKNKKYVDKNLDYMKINDDDDDDNTDDNNADDNENADVVDDTDAENKIEEKGIYRKIPYDKVTENNINYFTNIEEIVLNNINNNDALKITGGYNIIDTTDFIVVQRKINYILYNKYNKNELIYDCEIVIYRKGKNHGKHIGFQVLINNDNIYIIKMNILGIVSEDRIYMYLSSNEFINNIIYFKYNNKYVITYNPREFEIANMDKTEKIFLMRDRMQKLREERTGDVNRYE